MKASHKPGTDPLLDETGAPCGVLLAAAGRAEHEQGIAPIERLFGIAPGPKTWAETIPTLVPDMRMVRRRIEERFILDTPGNRPVTVQTDVALLIVGEASEAEALDLCRRYLRDDPVSGAWDERSFALQGHGPEGIRIVEDLHRAIQARDISMRDGFEERPSQAYGLRLEIASRAPRSAIETYDAHLPRRMAAQRDRDDAEARLRIEMLKRFPQFGRP